MPQPLNPDRRYSPGLDGLRALAVTAVVLYHVGFGWAVGGLLGVGVFFTLSGYLITDLLLGQLGTGRLQLAGFWTARARRLLPALILLLIAVTVWVTWAGPMPSGYTASALASLFYVGNWQLIFQHVSYFQRFAPPPPLEHLWSLGIEEQFYVVWPLLLLLGARLVPERSRIAGVRPRLALLTLVLATGSAVEMALLYHPGFDTSRIYFGTDTRAFELLAGAALAMVWPSRLLQARLTAGARRLCDGAGLLGLAGIGLLVWRTNEYTPFLYQGGFVLLTLATAVVVAALVHPGCRLGSVLGIGPLRWLGVRSYGIYLWHLPILTLTTPAGEHGVHLARAALQVTATVTVAAVSWRFVEEPIRHGALGRLRHRLRHGPQRRGIPKKVGIAALVPAVALATLGYVGVAATNRNTTTFTPPPSPRDVTSIPKPPKPSSPSHTYTVIPPLRTSCRAVIHVGDSTSEGLTSTSYLPNPAQRIEAQYARVGATIQHYEISGARSIVETFEDEPNAATVVQDWLRDGYQGCWVFALGTNDTANVYVGSHVGATARIDELMSLVGKKAPVLWVNVKSLLPSGPYSEHNMELWNDALLQACRTHPNMRVFDWSDAVHDSWFTSDGIHFNTPGYAARSRLIATGLADAFPAVGQSTRCLVR